MKCPKCGYIGFEHTDRCRNCGYDFVLAQGAEQEADLTLRDDEGGPLADFDLGDARRGAGAEAAPRRRRATGETPAPASHPDFDPRITPPARAAVPDLPLFGDGPDDLPIVPAAGPPPAVRRSTPLAAKARPRPTPRAVDSTGAPALPLPIESAWSQPPASIPAAPGERAAAGTPGVVVRVLAALVDALLLLGTDAVVVYFTLQICRLAPAEVLSLPLAPLLAFLGLLNGAYLVLLTAAGGQTLGKMAFGLKVIAADEGPLTLSRSLIRTAALILSALPAGLGLLPALFTAGHRGLHDQLADTRVVRLS